MTTLFQAMTNGSTTANGMATNKSSFSACVDLFGSIGSSRGKDISSLFHRAYKENSDYAIRTLLWARDIRGGAGERQTFISLLKELAKVDHDSASRALCRVPELGRWKDVVSFFDSEISEQAMALVAIALANNDGLAAKWMPRKGPDAARLRRFLELDARSYRKLLVSMSTTVEQQMCAGKWTEIDFSKLPSVASARYQKAFGRNAPDQYSAFIEKLEKGETKINAGAVFPYDITKSSMRGNASVAEAQWKAQPDYIQNSTERLLPVIDVSGSMGVSAGGSNTVTCMDVAVSLGLYVAERMKGVFADQFISFSEQPTIHKVSGSLQERLRSVYRAPWGYSTNLEAVFKLILDSAIRYNISEDEMPTKVVIFTDMEFNQADKRAHTALDMINDRYVDAGYKRPGLIFWNLNAREGNIPVTVDNQGTSIVSGFSPSLMKTILSGEVTTPVDMMLDVIMNERYGY
ncbi:MAG: hypothetical protein [Caudoviricetes sp.]|nr:MAG: hypothetical protein [Caudoviricetes sp.]